jgi:thiamine pyrophosphokinase
MHAVVVAHGDLGTDDAWVVEQLDRASLVIAADGGARAVWALGRCPMAVVGDLDSFDPALRSAMEARGCVFETHVREKDQTDTELALLLACRSGATSIDVLGALGGARFDHALANVLLLAHPDLAGVRVTLRDAQHEVCLLRGPSSLAVDGRPGDLVTLLPLSEEASGIDTRGLLYPLQGGTLQRGRGRGVSNELTGRRAAVSVRQGLLLVVVHHPAP